MACNIEKAIDALLTFKGTATRVHKVINDSIKAEKQFNTFINVPEKGLKASEYIAKFTAYLKNETGANVVESFSIVRDFVLKGTDTVFNSGIYRPISNTIEIASTSEISKFITSTESTLKDSISLSTEEKVRLNKILLQLKSFKSEAVLLHELVHATSAWSLRTNPTSPASLRVSEMFEYVLKNHPDIGANAYWKTSTQEFLSEALSSSKLMEDLMSIKLNKPVGKLTTLYDTLLHVALGLLGFKGKELDNALAVMMDSSLAMLEARKQAEAEVAKEPVKEETPKEAPKVQKESTEAPKPSKPTTMKEARKAWNEAKKTRDSDLDPLSGEFADAEVAVKEAAAVMRTFSKSTPTEKEEVKSDEGIIPTLNEQGEIAKQAAIQRLRKLATTTKIPALSKAYLKQADDIENNTCGV